MTLQYVVFSIIVYKHYNDGSGQSIDHDGETYDLKKHVLYAVFFLIIKLLRIGLYIIIIIGRFRFPLTQKIFRVTKVLFFLLEIFITLIVLVIGWLLVRSDEDLDS